MNLRILLIISIFLSICTLITPAYSMPIIDYTPTTKTVCLGGICNLELYSGTTFVNENDSWISVKKAKSLKNTGFKVVYIENDPDFLIDVIDFNYTSISMYLNFTGNWSDYPEFCSFNNITNETKCKFKLKDKWEEWNETTNEFDEFEIEYEQEFEIEPEDNKSKEVIEFKYEGNPLNRSFKFGGNSTTIQLQDAGTENLEDTLAYSCRHSAYLSNEEFSWFNHQPGANCYNTINLYRFNISMIPSSYYINNATLGLSIHENENTLDEGEYLNVSVNQLYNYPLYNITGSEYKWYYPESVVNFTSEYTFSSGYLILDGIYKIYGQYANFTIFNNTHLAYSWGESVEDSTSTWNITYDIGATQTVKRIRLFTGIGSIINNMPCSVTDVYICDDSDCSGESNLLVSTNNFSLISGWHEVSFSDTAGRYIRVKGDSYDGICGNASSTNRMRSFVKFQYSNATQTKPISDWIDGDNHPMSNNSGWNIALYPIFNWLTIPTVGQYNTTANDVVIITNDSTGFLYWNVTQMVSSSVYNNKLHFTAMLNSTDGNTSSYFDNVHITNKKYTTDVTKRPFLNITYEPSMNINSNVTNPTFPLYNQNVNMTLNATTVRGIVTYCNFTLTNPNDVIVIDNVNGTQTDDNWTSSNYTINISGNWTYNTTCSNSETGTDNSILIFRVDLGTITEIPTTKTYSQKSGESELFNLTFSHDGNQNNTIDFNLTGNINISNNFTVTFQEDPIILEQSETQKVLINITSNISMDAGTYTGNITWNRTEDGTSGIIEVTIYISGFVADVDISPLIVAKSLYNTASTTQTYTINNTGTYDATYCNLSVSGSISSYTTFNESSFNVNISTPIDVLMIITNPAVGTYASTLTLTCIATATGGIDTASSTLTVISSTVPITPPTPGGAGVIPDLCSNGICDSSESYESCPSDCYIGPNMTMSVTPEVYTIATNKGRLIERYFILNNPNSINITMDIEIICIEDESCEWAYFYDEELNRVKNLSVNMPAGNPVSPGRMTVIFYLDIPSDIEDKEYQFNLVAEQQTLAVSLPVKISVSESYFILYSITDVFTALKVEQVNPLTLIGIGFLLIMGFFGFLIKFQQKSPKKYR